jgi:hypothetical protein
MSRVFEGRLGPIAKKTIWRLYFLGMFLCYVGEFDEAKDALMKVFERKEFATTQQLGSVQGELNKFFQKQDDLANDLNEVIIPCTSQGCNLDNLILCDDALLLASGRIVDSANQSPACHLTRKYSPDCAAIQGCHKTYCYHPRLLLN